MSLVRSYELDMIPGGPPLTVRLSQYDSDFTLNFDLYASSGTFLVPLTATAKIRGTKPDGTVYSVDAVLYPAVKRVVVEGAQQITACAGTSVFELTLYYNDLELNTANFLVKVEPAAADKDTIPSESVIRELVDVIDRTDEIIAAARQADAAQAGIADYAVRAEAGASAAENSASAAAGSAQAAAESLESAQGTITSAKETAVEEINSARSDGVEAVQSAQTAGVSSVDDAYNAHVDAINQKAAQIAAAKTSAETTAAQAASQASEAVATASEAVSMTEDLLARLEEAEAALRNNVVTNGYVSNDVGYYVNADNNVLFTMTGIGGGSGGSGGGGSTVGAIFSCTNVTGWLAKTVSTQNKTCVVSFDWSSIEDEVPTGQGTMTITVNSVPKGSINIPQGRVSADLADYVNTGSNSVAVKISDVYGQSRTTIFTITVSELTIASPFDTSSPFTGALLFPYTLTGNVDHLVYFILDGDLHGTYQTRAANRQLTYAIPAQSHGAHSLRVYFETTISGETVRSNELYYEFTCVEDFNDDVIITSAFDVQEVAQYTMIQIPFTVYDPGALTADVSIYMNNVLVSEQTVDRTEQSYSYRCRNAGLLNIRIESGGTSKTINLTVTETEIEVEAETENLALFLTSSGRSNAEQDPAVWEYGSISCQFSGFNWASDGWQTDKDGVPVMRVSGDARIIVPYKPFSSDFRATGKTIEMEFATRNVLDYDSVILSCTSGGRGLEITAQKASLVSEQSSISTQYKEEEHVRVTFVAEKRSENRLLYIYINGIASGVVQYPTDDDFSQVEPVNISIGSSDCTIDIYTIRIYDNDLTRHQVLDNWIADTQDGVALLQRYTHNNVYDDYGRVVISSLPADLPHLIIECAELPQYKGDKKTISGTYVDPVYPSRGFTFEGAQADVQGTSSQYYPRKNYKIKFKNGFQTAAGSASKYAMNPGAVPTNTFTFKADVASSEGANNVELARLYNDACPYRTPAQEEDDRIRQGIDGFPIVIFWRDTVTDTVRFLGKYNFNNDKGTEEVFGFADPDESWEIKNNTSDRVLWKSDDYNGEAWLNDFEGRYPEDNTDPAQLAEFAAWVKSTDRTAATGNALANPVEYAGTTYTNDTEAYRLAKFKAEAGNYMEMQSTLFYYLFTELFLMVDSRAKNAFPSFIGTEVGA